MAALVRYCAPVEVVDDVSCPVLDDHASYLLVDGREGHGYLWAGWKSDQKAEQFAMLQLGLAVDHLDDLVAQVCAHVHVDRLSHSGERVYVLLHVSEMMASKTWLGLVLGHEWTFQVVLRHCLGSGRPAQD